ncbi:MAG TPA: hypothetical protein VG370_01085 [Chloroflexota bacterium]|jgi:hypothetical protein|nr:hypothetical protein [Chloroflexota bacterium]
MAVRRELIRSDAVAGEPVTLGQVRLVPQSRALVVRLPFGGFVWNRPVAVRVERGGETTRVPIHDVTRVVQLGLFGLSFVVLVAALVAARR